MIDAFNIYDKMEKNNILLSFKGDITSELLTSILQIMENKLDNMQEEPKIKKKVYNVLVECLQNLYHHMDDATDHNGDKNRSAIFMIGKNNTAYNIITGNYILNENIHGLKQRLDEVNSLSKEELKDYYKQVLNNGEMSLKGGGGLGMIDIARKTGEKLEYNFLEIDNKVSFFTLVIKVTQLQLQA
ncbi:MAG: SiaB family protein kinase [Bacteroidetes bacterium]|nr:SiaB family protein kinase [Bacteroidota bacterium]